jgi:hypothetical protein
MQSIEFWKKRYQLGDDSGAGSASNLKNFKVNFINEFVQSKNIESILDFGHGDLRIAKELIVDNYTGIDIFNPPNDYNLNLVNVKFDEYYGNSAELVICLDVLYHILEPEQEYMRKSIDKMFEKSDKYVIIYAQDSRDNKFDMMYRNHLYNSKWIQHIESSHKETKLIYEQERPQNGTTAKFFIYEKTK